MRQGRAAVIGMFDGVHRGHRFLLDFLQKEAAKRNLAPEVFTFPRHPLSIVAPERAPKLLTEPEEKLRQLADVGFPSCRVNFVVFDEYTRSLTADRFLAMLSQRYGVELIVRGFNNRFGTERNLSSRDYQRIAASHGIELIDAPPYCIDCDRQSQEISSSLIRSKLLAGEVDSAATLIGRPYSLTGTVVSGKQLGRKIGFPTANIAISHPSKLIPADGVYICEVITHQPDIKNANPASFRAMVNIGSRPTVDDPHPSRTIEAHILGFNNNIYGQQLTLKFRGRLRDEKKFSSLEALELQLEKDCEETQKFRFCD